MKRGERFLVTGGCGFIGSHLCERLLADGCGVIVIDDLSTGCHDNVAHLESHPQFELVIGSVLDEDLVCESVKQSDAVFHLASAVGVKLIMDRPVRTIETIFLGTDTVFRFANRYRKPVLLTSTSEVYGKSVAVPFDEEGDRVAGPTHKHRWSYACAKALDEFLALAYWKESHLPVIVARLFNTVGPRQTGQYGMVIPSFIDSALTGDHIEVYGDGSQTRCFAHVLDTVDALTRLMRCPAARGEVVNIGSQEEISILDLAHRIKRELRSDSQIRFLSYDAAYGSGFEEMKRRVPSIEKARRLVGWEPQYNLERIIRDVAEWKQPAEQQTVLHDAG